MLIAECSNCHFGSMDSAKDHIRAAQDHGADLVKFQAFNAEDIKSGSMGLDFYRKCQFSLDQCIELMGHGVDLGIQVFFSIFSKDYNKISAIQSYHKIAASQSSLKNLPIIYLDNTRTFISFKPGDRLPNIHFMKPLYATEYFDPKPDLPFMRYLGRIYKRDFGISDHTVGINTCKKAILEYGATIVEKHFTLKKDLEFKGKVFRDTVHGATPKELEIIAMHLNSGG